METRLGLLSSCPWLKWRGSCSTGYAEVCRVVLFRRTTSRLHLEGILWNFWASQLEGLFRKLEWLCEMKDERIRGLNRNLNDGWYFRKLEVISQVGPFRKLVRNLICNCEIGFWSCEMAHVCLGGVSQVAKIFASWIVNLGNLALRISQVGPHFRKLKYCYIFHAFSSFLVFYGFPPIPLKFLLILIIQKV